VLNVLLSGKIFLAEILEDLEVSISSWVVHVDVVSVVGPLDDGDA